MKKYLSICFAALALGTVVSCEKFLDVQSQGYPTQDQYFQNDQQAIDAVDACYYEFTAGDEMYGRELFYEQICANVVVPGRGRSDMTAIATLNNITGDERMRRVFKSIYQGGLSRCNWVVQQLLLKQETTELTSIESRSLGEAYFARALWHFLSAYRYGTKDLGVPFVAYEKVEGGYNNEIPEQQETVMKNYELIIADLVEAEKLLPKYEEYAAADRGRVHKASAAALMAKVYAYWATWDKSQWANVIPCVNRLETDYGRDLVPHLEDLYKPGRENFWHVEDCFSFPGNGGDNPGGSEFTGVSLQNGGWDKWNGWGQFKPSLDIYEEMAKDNVGGVKNHRLAVSILEYNDEFQYFGETKRFFDGRDFVTGFLIGKWIQAFAPADPVAAGWASSNGDYPTTSINFPVIRFADCLLLRAEAYLASGQPDMAAIDINRIRTRSGLTPLPGNATWTDLYHERVCELAFELGSDHGYDCRRWAYSGDPEIKALAIAELEAHPRVRVYEDPQNPESDFVEGPYDDFKSPAKVWNDKYISWPYPSEQINKSAGKLKNPPSWQ